MLVHEGPARIFESDEDATEAIKTGKIHPGDVIVIRYEGPKGGPGMREMLNPTSAIAGYGSWIYRCTDHRRTFQRSIQRCIYRTRFTGSSSRRTDCACGGRRYHPDQYSGTNIKCRTVSEEELAARKAKWQPREPKVTRQDIWHVMQSMVTSGNRGAILDSSWKKFINTGYLEEAVQCSLNGAEIVDRMSERTGRRYRIRISGRSDFERIRRII